MEDESSKRRTPKHKRRRASHLSLLERQRGFLHVPIGDVSLVAKSHSGISLVPNSPRHTELPGAVGIFGKTGPKTAASREKDDG